MTEKTFWVLERAGKYVALTTEPTPEGGFYDVPAWTEDVRDCRHWPTFRHADDIRRGLPHPFWMADVVEHAWIDPEAYTDGLAQEKPMTLSEDRKRLSEALTYRGQFWVVLRESPDFIDLLGRLFPEREPLLGDGEVSDRDVLGRMVREVWVRWARAQHSPKESWLVPYDDLGAADKEADRMIGEALFAAGRQSVAPPSPLAEDEGLLERRVIDTLLRMRAINWKDPSPRLIGSVRKLIEDLWEALRTRSREPAERR